MTNKLEGDILYIKKQGEPTQQIFIIKKCHCDYYYADDIKNEIIDCGCSDERNTKACKMCHKKVYKNQTIKSHFCSSYCFKMDDLKDIKIQRKSSKMLNSNTYLIKKDMSILREMEFAEIRRQEEINPANNEAIQFILSLKTDTDIQEFCNKCNRKIQFSPYNVKAWQRYYTNTDYIQGYKSEINDIQIQGICEIIKNK